MQAEAVPTGDQTAVPNGTAQLADAAPATPGDPNAASIAVEVLDEDLDLFTPNPLEVTMGGLATLHGESNDGFAMGNDDDTIEFSIF